MSADFVKKVQIYIEKNHMIKKGERILTGVSGGADSVCLLLVLHELEKILGFSLAAVHVEHGIRGEESLSDAAFTEKLCAGLGIPFRRFSVDASGHATRTHQSLEEAARELRYGCFASACAELGATKVAVAHHANDNAETMLFHLARGSGIRGLGGISPMVEYHLREDVFGSSDLVSDENYKQEDVSGEMSFVPMEKHQDGGSARSEAACELIAGQKKSGFFVVRPLLCVTRAEIEEYLGFYGQTYCVDSTNADMTYTRNRIRGCVLPELVGVNAQAISHMAQTAVQLREICAYLDETARKDGADAYEIVYNKRFFRVNESENKIFQGRTTSDAGIVNPCERDGLQVDGAACETVCENAISQADGMEAEFSRIEIIRIFSQPFLALHRVLRTTLLQHLIGRIAGSKKDITSGHVEQVLQLFEMREGKRTDLPYGISARRVADGVELYHREKCPDVQMPQRTERGIHLGVKDDSGSSVLAGNGCLKEKIDENGFLKEKSAENRLTGNGLDNEILQQEEGAPRQWKHSESREGVICVDLPVPGEISLGMGRWIRTELFPFDGNFEKIPKKRYTKWMDYDRIMKRSLEGTIIRNPPRGCPPYDKVINTFQIRTRRPGDYLFIDAQGGRKKLKRYFIDEKIPASERERTLLVANGSHILWVIGHRISEGCKVTRQTRRILCLQYQEMDSTGDDEV